MVEGVVAGDMYRTLIRATNNETYDVTSIASNIEYYTDITGQPGTFTFLLGIDPNGIMSVQWKDGIPTVGDEVFFSNDDTLIFKGFIFTVGTDSDGTIKVTAYDQMRYLMNEDTFVADEQTASDLFKTICARASLNSNQYKVVTESSYALVSKVYNSRSYYQIMEEAISDTLRGEGRAYYLIDRAGVLEFNYLGADITDIAIGEGSLLTGYRYEKSIDDSTYNRIIVLTGSEEEGYTKSAVEQDDESIMNWGMLQLMLQADKSLMDDAKIDRLAKTALDVYNKPSTNLTLSAIGDDSIIAGTLFYLHLPSVGVDSRLMYAESCSHKYSNDLHTMELVAKIVPEDMYES